MNDMYLFIVFAASAYVLQAVISWKQLKHFNQTYSELRRKGKVAIGKRPGKIRSGTIVMLAIDDHDQVLEVRKMQGVTSWQNFIHYLSMRVKISITSIVTIPQFERKIV